MNLSYRTVHNAKAIALQWGKTENDIGKAGWFKINDSAENEEVEILIYDVIGWPFLSAEILVSKIMDFKGRPLNFAIHSPGGDMADAIAIHAAMKRHDAKVTARIDSLAASSATLIAMGADEVNAYKTSTFMIHNPWFLTIGNEFAHSESLDILKQFGNKGVDIYSEKATVGKREIKSLMNGTDKRDGTWMTATEAKEKGFIDNIIEGGSSKPKNKFNLSVFAGVPEEFTGNDSPTVRDVEKLLRDAGVPKQKAMAIIAGCKDVFAADDQGEPDRDSEKYRDIIQLAKSII